MRSALERLLRPPIEEEAAMWASLDNVSKRYAPGGIIDIGANVADG